MLNKKNRFTLIELIVVIVVLGILSAIVVPNIKDVREKAEIAAVKSNVRNIQTAVDMFQLNYGYYPTDKQPEFIEDKDNPENTSGFLVGREPINFEKDNFVTDYLRNLPKDVYTYYIDAYGVVSFNEDNNPKILIPKNISIGVGGGLISMENGEKYRIGSPFSIESEIESALSPQEVEILKDFEFVQLEIGDGYAIGLTKDGEAYSLGNNGRGQLGSGNTTTQHIPEKINLTNNSKIKQIAVGGSNTFLLLEDGSIYASGENYYGQLGVGHKNKVNTFTQVQIPSLKPIKEIIIGINNSIAIAEDGSIYGWGNSGFGVNGSSNFSTPIIIPFLQNKAIKQIISGDTFSMVLLEDGRLYGTGRNNSGELGIGYLGTTVGSPDFIENKFFKDKNIKKIFSGYDFSMALLENGEVYVWGNNAYGQLGLGSISNAVHTPIKNEFLSNSSISELDLDYRKTLVRLSNGEIYACGSNDYGELSLENKEKISTFTKISFDNIAK